jgi:hypothetical protein
MTLRDVTRDKLPKVHAFDEAGFAEWLKIGFLEFALKNEELFPFGEAWEFIGRFPDITDDIEAIHNVLWPAERKKFHIGLARALAEIDLAQPHAFVTARRLIRVAEKTSATEILSVLSTKIFCPQSEWLADSESGLELLDTAADAAVDLACKTTDARHALYNLAISPSFRSSSARKTLLALCSVAPEDLDLHLQLLARHLTWMFVEREKETGVSLADARARLFLDVARLVDVGVLMETVDLYNSEVEHPQLGRELSWWGEGILPINTSDEVARELAELRRKIQLLPPEVAEETRWEASSANELGRRFWDNLSGLANSGSVSASYGTVVWNYDVSGEDLIAEAQCARFVDEGADAR